jgi:hypothetical protein
MAKKRPVPTEEQREQRRAEQRELVVASIEQLRSSDGWRAYLNARARFRSYSARNVLLILEQHPTATRVAGFRAWLDLGCCVTKGSTAIRIWAPCPPSKRQLKAWRDAGADPDNKPRTGWRLASVFDTLSRDCVRRRGVRCGLGCSGGLCVVQVVGAPSGAGLSCRPGRCSNVPVPRR